MNDTLNENISTSVSNEAVSEGDTGASKTQTDASAATQVISGAENNAIASLQSETSTASGENAESQALSLVSNGEEENTGYSGENGAAAGTDVTGTSESVSSTASENTSGSTPTDASVNTSGLANESGDNTDYANTEVDGDNEMMTDGGAMDGDVNGDGMYAETGAGNGQSTGVTNPVLIGGVTVAALALGIACGIFLAKRRIKKGINLYEDK